MVHRAPGQGPCPNRAGCHGTKVGMCVCQAWGSQGVWAICGLRCAQGCAVVGARVVVLQRPRVALGTASQHKP